MDYEDLTIDPWPAFRDLASRAETFELYLSDTKRDTLETLAQSLEASLDEISEIALERPEVGEERLDTVSDGVPRIIDDADLSIRVTGKLRDVDVQTYISTCNVVAVVPSSAITGDSSGVS